jgi:hypothetical protein
MISMLQIHGHHATERAPVEGAPVQRNITTQIGTGLRDKTPQNKG